MAQQPTLQEEVYARKSTFILWYSW